VTRSQITSDPLDGASVVNLSAVTWDFPLIGRTRMLCEAWWDMGIDAPFVQVPSLRSAAQRLGMLRREPDPKPSGRGPDVLRPLPLPPAASWRLFGERTVRLMARGAAREFGAHLAARIDVERSLAVVVSPVWVPWLDKLGIERVIYDCIDHAEIHVPRRGLEPMIERWERELIDQSRAVVVTARGLGEHCRAIRPDIPIALIRNGVDARWFQERAACDPRPADLPARDASRPIVGFVGALYSWIDWDLIEAVARELETHRFVFVGPIHGSPAQRRVDRLANTAFLGPRPYRLVPSYMPGFDAAWVPFDAGRVSSLANPVKIYEYLSPGLPVATTPVADADEFSELCDIARDADQMARALAGLTDPEARTPAASDQRKAYADEHIWHARASALIDFAGSTSHGPAGAGA